VVPDSSKFEFFDIAALPHFAGFRPVSVFGGWNLMISKYSNHKTASLKFVQFALQTESQELLFLAGGYIPVNLQVYQDSTFMQAHPELPYYQELLQRGIHRPYRPDYTRISDIISHYVHQSIKNEIGVAEALSRATLAITSDRFILK
jgi:ABC-type glycerol-3-phosphate transport system substrate-binding protein